MIRMSPGQFALFEESRGNTRTAPGARPRARRPTAALPENIVESQVLGWLRARGWRCIRQNNGVFVGAGALMGILEKAHTVADVRQRIGGCMTRFGEKGRCDWLCIRKESPGALAHSVFELEVKGPGKKPSPDQLAYICKLNATGTLAVWVDCLEMLTKWHRENFE